MKNRLQGKTDSKEFLQVNEHQWALLEKAARLLIEEDMEAILKRIQELEDQITVLTMRMKDLKGKNNG